MYDQLESSYFKPLCIRVISRNLAVFALYWATKYFALTTVIMVHLCAPLVSICMAGFILKEKVTIQQWIILLIAFSSIAIMIIGDDSNGKRPQYTASAIVYFFFLLKPFALSASTMAMRTSRRLNEEVVDCYKAISLFLILAVAAPLTG